MTKVSHHLVARDKELVLPRTLIKDSKIVVLDEPTSNVDPQAEEDIF